MLARDDGYGAIGAMAVAALADLEVGIMARGGEHTTALTRRRDVAAEVLDEVLVVELAIIFVDLRDLLLKLLAVTL